jgi:hypothetical protein
LLKEGTAAASLLSCLSSADVESKRACLGVLSNLTVHEQGKTKFVRLGLVQSLLSVIGSAEEDPKVKREAVRCLRNVAFDPEAKKVLSDLAGVRLLLSLLTPSGSGGDVLLDLPPTALGLDVLTVRYAVRCLSILSVDADLRQTMLSEEALGALVTLLSSADVETRRAAVGTMINLSVNKSHKLKIKQAGAISPLISCLESRLDDETVRYAVRAMYNLTINEDIRHDAIVMGATPLLLDNVMFDRRDTESKYFALSTLLSLTQSEAGAADVRRRGGVKDLLVALQSGMDNRNRVTTIKILRQMAIHDGDSRSLMRTGGVIKALSSLMQNWMSSPSPSGSVSSEEALLSSLELLREVGFDCRFEIRDCGVLQMVHSISKNGSEGSGLSRVFSSGSLSSLPSSRSLQDLHQQGSSSSEPSREALAKAASKVLAVLETDSAMRMEIQRIDQSYNVSDTRKSAKKR